ncbi:class I SAM-dependent methyltransferase [Sphingomonas sp. 8AM]|uniref:methyltransferase n=1 Tax=Sphingomonas sp. 8AM TaxID=2653170 RepID=UPI0012EFD36C|nr:class I SAM-dependent methyltransferase [Sphingomonas sp. 8AM]VXC99592.1 Methyltransferase [Sphingomonas sp. 8AM]
MRPITLDGFDAKFAGNDDPWATFTDRNEALKRRAILHALGSGVKGRVLELAAGNGSNSVDIAPRALRLDATEATSSGTALVAKALAGRPRARATRLAVPARLPRTCYDVIVVAEVIYYLTARNMAQTARDVAAALRRGGTLVLAHHHVDYPDFAQHAAHLQRAFLTATRRRWQVRVLRRTGRWTVFACRLLGAQEPAATPVSEAWRPDVSRRPAKAIGERYSFVVSRAILRR